MTMITLQTLTPTQSTIIRSAARHPEGKIALPATLQGGARANALKGLLTRGWIVEAGDGHLLTDAGYAAIGQQRPPPSPPIIDDTPARNRVQPCRPGTKLAKVVAALQNPDGATIFQLMCCTGWQPHTIRGALSWMVRKKLGLNVVSTKAAGGERVYRIA
jgi:hypothetical protein